MLGLSGNLKAVSKFSIKIRLHDKYGLNVARKGGLAPTDTLNRLGAQELESFLGIERPKY